MRKILLLLVFLITTNIVFSSSITTINYPTENKILNGIVDINFTITSNFHPTLNIDYNKVGKTWPVNVIENNIILLNNPICDSNNFSIGVNCIYSWDTNNYPDGNYFILMYVNANNVWTPTWSEKLIIDNSPPIISGFDSNYYNPENGPLLLNLSSVGSDINFESISIKLDANVLDTNNYLLLNNFTDNNYDSSNKKLIINTGDLNNGLTYQVDVNVSDLAGNFAFADKNITIDKNKPIINSVIIPEFTNSKTPSIIIDAIDNESGIKDIAFSCNDNNFTNWIVTDNNNPFTYSDFNILNINYGCPQVDGNRNIYVIVRDLADNNATVGPIIIFYDSNNPEMLNLSSTISQNNVTLIFDATDYNGSGIKGYYIKKNDGNWEFTNQNTFSFNDLANGDYNFFVKAIDFANNKSIYLDTNLNVNYTPPSPPSTGGGGGSSGWNSWIIPNNTQTIEQENETEENTDELIEDTNQTIIEPITIQEEEIGQLEILNTTLILEEEIDNSPTGLFGLGLVQNSIFPLILLLLLALFLIFILKKKKNNKNKLYYED